MGDIRCRAQTWGVQLQPWCLIDKAEQHPWVTLCKFDGAIKGLFLKWAVGSTLSIMQKPLSGVLRFRWLSRRAVGGSLVPVPISAVPTPEPTGETE